jgi:signal peptidase I
MKFDWFFEVLKIVLIALAIVIPIRYFLFQPFVVRGASMEPNYYSGDYLIIDEISYRFRDPQRFEVIVFDYPLDPSQRFIKRIIGLPNETVEIKDGKIFITKDNSLLVLNENDYLSDQFIESWNSLDNFGPITLKENEYFVLGDNRNASSDSRRWGILPRENIIGRVYFRISLPTFFAKTLEPIN